MRTSTDGIELIKSFEGCKLRAYKDVVGVWTIGYGHTGPDVKFGMEITSRQAGALLADDLRRFEDAVRAATLGKANQHQFDAMVSLAFNIGIAGFNRSTVLKAHNRRDFAAASRAFSLWNKAGGKPWPGLTRRRAAEAALYLQSDEAEAMPQVIEPERGMSASGINRAATAAGATASLAAVSETVSTVSGIKSGIDGLGDWLLPVLLVAVVALCAYIVWSRYSQRKGGWA